MVSLSIIGMTGWVNPFFLAARRPWTLFVARRRSAGAFFCVDPLGALPSGGSAGGEGARWSAAARDAPGRHALAAGLTCTQNRQRDYRRRPWQHRRVWTASGVERCRRPWEPKPPGSPPAPPRFGCCMTRRTAHADAPRSSEGRSKH
jgi:hypothetical protein